MSFLIEVAPIFTRFLTMFQEEGWLIHIPYHELQRMLSTLMLRFLKAEVVNCKVGKALLDIDVRDEGNQLHLESMNVGVDVKVLLKKCTKDSRKHYQKEMQGAFIKIAIYFLSRLPLNNSFLKDMICLHPLRRIKMSANPVSRLAKLMPHVIILSSKIYSIVNKQSVLRVDDDILEDWYFNQDRTFKCLDYYWRNLSSWRLCLVPQDTPAVERNLSDNKNTLTKERASLGQETLKALRLSKEFVWCNDGGRKLIVSPEMGNSICDAYNPYKTRKKNEELAAARLAAKKKEEEEASKRRTKKLEKAGTKKEKLEKRKNP